VKQTRGRFSSGLLSTFSKVTIIETGDVVKRHIRVYRNPAKKERKGVEAQKQKNTQPPQHRESDTRQISSGGSTAAVKFEQREKSTRVFRVSKPSNEALQIWS
jgi:hypothetical protein